MVRKVGRVGPPKGDAAKGAAAPPSPHGHAHTIEVGHGHANDDLKQSLLAGAGHTAPPHEVAKGATADADGSAAVEQSRSQSRKISLLDAVLAPTATAYASTGAPRGNSKGLTLTLTL